jgi:hypothetical protein
MLYDREKQKGNANRATLAVSKEANGVLGCRRIAAKKTFC